MTSKEKSKFRSSKDWKTFRWSLIKQRGPFCELCGTKYSGKRLRMLQVHHLDPNNYTDLNPDKFKLVCSSDHELIERVCKKVLSKTTILFNKIQWFLLLENFLTIESKIKLREQLNEDNQ